jgi:hypothetical protein
MALTLPVLSGMPAVRSGILGRMQWHWGNIGSFLAGLAALIATVFTVSYAIV